VPETGGLNSATHLIAVTQVRMRNSIGRAYFDKKIAVVTR
jgi:hypothetical protein